MPITIEWDSGDIEPHIPIQDLIDQVFGSQEGFNAQVVRLLPMTGSESGATVMRVVIVQPHSPIPLILKCGEAELISRERTSYERWHLQTGLWRATRPYGSSPAPIPVNRGSTAWSAMLYELAGHNHPEDLVPLGERVARYAQRRESQETSWSAVFDTLASTLEPGYHYADGRTPASQAGSRILAVPAKELRPIVSSVAAVANGHRDGEDVVSWGEVTHALCTWQDYVNRLDRDVPVAVCHGDLRGSNVLLSRRSGHPFLIDFGSIGIGSPIMDLARLEIDLIMRSGGVPEHQWPGFHETLFNTYWSEEWEHDDQEPLLRVIGSLRRSFERVPQIRIAGGRNTEEQEIRFFHACRVASAARMLRWADRTMTSTDVRRHLLWFFTEGVPRVASNITRGLRAAPSDVDPVYRHVREVGLTGLHHRKDWATRNAMKVQLLESPDDVWLMAHTAWSFLSANGVPVLRDAFRERALKGPGVYTRVLMMSPYTIEGIARAVQQNLHREQSLEILRHSTNTFTRFNLCCGMFKTLIDEGADPTRVQLRISPLPIGGSVLLAGSRFFYEPYQVGLASRRDRELQVFPEMEFRGNAAAGYVETIREQLEWFWKRSVTIDTFWATEKDHRGRAEEYLRQLVAPVATS